MISLRRGGHEATVAPVGAALLSYSVEGEAVVSAPGGDAAVSEFAGSVLAPWPNRLADGVWRWDGTDLRVPVNEPSRRTALHGLVFDRAWTVIERTDTHVVLGIGLGDEPGYPFHVDVTARYALDGERLSISLRARNRGNRSAPAGLGSHPYFALRGALDDVVLTVASTEMLESDARLLPAGRRPFTYFARGNRLGGRAFDVAMRRDPESTVVAVLEEDDRVVHIGAGATCRWLMLYTADTLPPPRRRRVVAIEPTTCPPNAFNTLQDLDILAPGEQLELSWSVTVVAK